MQVLMIKDRVWLPRLFVEVVTYCSRETNGTAHVDERSWHEIQPRPSHRHGMLGVGEAHRLLLIEDTFETLITRHHSNEALTGDNGTGHRTFLSL
jgi:hypothetical protein